MNSLCIHHYDQITLRPLNELSALDNADWTIQVVPGYEADADQGLVSEEAPLGRALLGRSCGEVVTIAVAGRSLSMRIVGVVSHAALAA